MKKQGFTLSEILLVLSVIGVVAALTIPTLIQKASDDQNKSAWKKAFSELSQATNRIMTENGGTMKGALPSSHTAARDVYLKFLSSIKQCASYETNCGNNFCTYFSSIKQLGSGSYNLFGNCAGAGGGFATLSNGSFFLITSSANGGNAATCSPYCALIGIDVNGLNPPNVIGKDIYGAFVLEDGLKPYGITGISGADYSNTCISSSSGLGCAAENLFK